jgi:hypothetical protein
LKGWSRFLNVTFIVYGIISVVIMSQGRLFRLPCLQVLLIAFAVQGITPDAQDLASINALRIFCPILNKFDTAADQDEWPDDVCEPVHSGAGLSFPQPRDRSGTSAFELAMTEARFRPIEPPSHRFMPAQANLATMADLTCSLCRLLC